LNSAKRHIHWNKEISRVEDAKTQLENGLMTIFYHVLATDMENEWEKGQVKPVLPRLHQV
jgi:hypothetical protein